MAWCASAFVIDFFPAESTRLAEANADDARDLAREGQRHGERRDRTIFNHALIHHAHRPVGDGRAAPRMPRALRRIGEANAQRLESEVAQDRAIATAKKRRPHRMLLQIHVEQRRRLRILQRKVPHAIVLEICREAQHPVRAIDLPDAEAVGAELLADAAQDVFEKFFRLRLPRQSGQRLRERIHLAARNVLRGAAILDVGIRAIPFRDLAAAAPESASTLSG